MFRLGVPGYFNSVADAEATGRRAQCAVGSPGPFDSARMERAVSAVQSSRESPSFAFRNLINDIETVVVSIY